MKYKNQKNVPFRQAGSLGLYEKKILSPPQTQTCQLCGSRIPCAVRPWTCLQYFSLWYLSFAWYKLWFRVKNCVKIPLSRWPSITSSRTNNNTSSSLLVNWDVLTSYICLFGQGTYEEETTLHLGSLAARLKAYGRHPTWSNTRPPGSLDWDLSPPLCTSRWNTQRMGARKN